MLSNLLYRFRRRRLLFLLIPFAAAIVSACSTGNPQDTFTTGGPVAEKQADLFRFIFWIAVVVFVLVEGAVIFITLKYRRKSDDEMPVQTTATPSSRSPGQSSLRSSSWQLPYRQ
jgi:heme/copper-type cytochrome/quinol oxidase subunit 2